MNNKYKILTGIPIPRYKGNGVKRGYLKGPNKDVRYPWHLMEVGDALCIGPYEPKVMTNVLTIANHSFPARHMDYKFAARTIEGQIHVFRIQ